MKSFSHAFVDVFPLKSMPGMCHIAWYRWMKPLGNETYLCEIDNAIHFKTESYMSQRFFWLHGIQPKSFIPLIFQRGLKQNPGKWPRGFSQGTSHIYSIDWSHAYTAELSNPLLLQNKLPWDEKKWLKETVEDTVLQGVTCISLKPSPVNHP